MAKFEVKADFHRFNRSLDALVDTLAMSLEDQLPYVSGSVVKGGMNNEKTPKKAQVRKKARIKAANMLELNYKFSNEGEFQKKNVYINVYNGYPKAHLALKHGHTGKVYYPQFQNAGGVRGTGFTPNMVDYIEGKLMELEALSRQLYEQDLVSAFMPKTPYYDILMDLKSLGVNLDLLSPQVWTGGRGNIERAVVHGRNSRPQNGFAWKEGDPLASAGFVIRIRNTYPSVFKRKQDRNLIVTLNRFSRKYEADLKHGTFADMKRTAARYPWIEARAN